MLKPFVFVLIVLVLTSSTNGQIKTDRERANLAGAVQNVRTSIWNYGGPESGRKPDSGDTVTFDKAGNELERIMVSDFGEAMGKQTQTFDKAGNLVESTWMDTKGRVREKRTFVYKDGRLSEILAYDGLNVIREKTTKIYNGNGSITEEIYHDPQKAVAKTVFTYDASGSATEMAFFMIDGTKAIAPVGPCLGGHKVTFTYDSQKRPITKAVFEAGGREKKRWTFGYDERGNYRSYEVKSGSIVTKIEYTYEYDSQGNWIRSTSVSEADSSIFDLFKDPSGKAVTPGEKKEFLERTRSTRVTTRDITYFK